jgi:hypothetical protein
MHVHFNLKGSHQFGWAMAFTVLLSLIIGPGCSREADLSFTTPYQVVFLDNGQAYIGKLEQAASPFPLLRDVFYVQRQVEGDKKEVKNLLTKRGSEWHMPEYMRINARHIVMIEPVTPDSRMAKLIQEAKALSAVAPPAGPPSTAIPNAGEKLPPGK